MTEVLWRPGRPQDSLMHDFMEYARREGGWDGGGAGAAALDDERATADYASLHRWSLQPEFWRHLWRWARLPGVMGDGPVLARAEGAEGAEGMTGNRWFAGARLNLAEAALRPGADDDVAIIGALEDGARRSLSRAELRAQVAAMAAFLHGRGVRPGDRVAAILPNVPEAAVGALAAASIGAVWTSCSPDFGRRAVLDRFGQCQPVVMFAANACSYNGKRMDKAQSACELAAELPSVRDLVLVPVLEPAIAPAEGPRARTWHWREALQEHPDAPLRFAPLAFDHPLYIMYSSGTTGAPKCMVHGHGGTLLQHVKEHRLHCDMRPGDRLLYFTTCGWMMWNWMLTALASGLCLVLYDGSPLYPGPLALADLVERERVSAFGCSARYIQELMHRDVHLLQSHKMAALRLIMSTGSPLSDLLFRYVYEHLKTDVHLASISGGTDIISCFALGNPMLPVRAGQLQCAGLGMAVAVFDDGGKAVVGERGELVCTAPFPSRPTGFWDDADGRKYRSAYFETWGDGVWAHGDYAQMTAEGALTISGRSDATLNPGGVRIGTAEIYRQLEDMEGMTDALCICQPVGGDERIVLFVVCDAPLDDARIADIRARIRRGASPRHVPAIIHSVDAVPRTRSGKLAEMAVRAIACGREPGNLDALANAGCLEQYRTLLTEDAR